MYMAEFVERMKGIRICPVLVIEDKNDAIPLGKALLEGKLPVAEVTFRTAAAKESIALMVKEYPDLYVGAGTVITLQQCKDAVEAGAKFIVSPSFSHEVAAFCRDREIPYCPGVLTPTEISMAMSYDIPVVKFFPAGQFGGVQTIKSYAAVFQNLYFMPTGGVNLQNIGEYLSFSKVLCVGGTWLCKKEFLETKDFALITKNCLEAYELSH